MEIEVQKQNSVRASRCRRAVVCAILGVIVTVAVVVGCVLGLRSSSTPQYDRITSFQTTNDWYDACLSAALQCDFYFDGSVDSVPGYDLSTTKDNVDFTDNLVSRTSGSIGGLNSNGDGNELIFSTGAQLITKYNSQFTKYQFKPNGDQLMHETFQGTSETYATGKCVRVHFTSWQVLDGSGNVQENVNGDACAVFRTTVDEEPTQDETCTEAAQKCDFMFEGHTDDVPVYTIDYSSNDVAFSDRIVSRDTTVNVGVMNSNGKFASFVLGNQQGEVTMHDYIDAFTPYQFKPTGDMPRLMHETFQVHNDVEGKCVKVYFTQWQVLNDAGYVTDNVNTTDATACVVFQTA